MMEKVYFVEDGLGYGERFVLSYLSARKNGSRSFIYDGIGGLAEEMNVSRKVLSSYFQSLEKKGCIKLEKIWTRKKLVITSVKLNLKGGKWIKVPASFLYTGSLKERGLLLTIVANHKLVGFGSRKLKKTSFLLKEWVNYDIRSTATLRKFLKSLQSKGFILIEKTKPFYVVRVII